MKTGNSSFKKLCVTLSNILPDHLASRWWLSLQAGLLAWHLLLCCCFFPFLQLVRYSPMPGASCSLPTSKTSFTFFFISWRALARCLEGVNWYGRYYFNFYDSQFETTFFVNLRIKPLTYLNRKLPHTTIKRYFATWALLWVRGFFSAHVPRRLGYQKPCMKGLCHPGYFGLW